MITKWTKVSERKPPEDVPVIAIGPSGNEVILTRRSNLYFLECGMYVYYTPTMWKSL